MLKRGFILLLATIIALFSTTIVFADQHSPDKGDFGNQNGIVPFYVGISNTHQHQRQAHSGPHNIRLFCICPVVTLSLRLLNASRIVFLPADR